MYNNALNVYFSNYFPSRLKEDDISFSKKKYVHSEWGVSRSVIGVEKEEKEGKVHSREEDVLRRFII